MVYTLGRVFTRGGFLRPVIGKHGSNLMGSLVSLQRKQRRRYGSRGFHLQDEFTPPVILPAAHSGAQAFPEGPSELWSCDVKVRLALSPGASLTWQLDPLSVHSDPIICFAFTAWNLHVPLPSLRLHLRLPHPSIFVPPSKGCLVDVFCGWIFGSKIPAALTFTLTCSSFGMDSFCMKMFCHTESKPHRSSAVLFYLACLRAVDDRRARGCRTEIGNAAGFGESLTLRFCTSILENYLLELFSWGHNVSGQSMTFDGRKGLTIWERRWRRWPWLCLTFG